jgi:hypothetical protein
MRYTAAQDIWKLEPAQISQLQPGQWVYAGEPQNRGQYWGVKQSGSIVVAWHQNAQRADNYAQYQHTLRQYAQA